MKDRTEIKTFRDPEGIVEAASVDFVEAMAQRGDSGWSVALSGGRIAAPFFRSVAAEVVRRRVSVARVHFFWADERCVPADHLESNYREAREALFAPLGVAPGMIHRIHGEDAPPVAAVNASEEMIRTIGLGPDRFPALDLVVLGMGEDGHVASLFPGQAPCGADEPVYQAVEAVKPPPRRITLSYRSVISARAVWVLIPGLAKERALRLSLSGGETPLGKVICARERTTVYTDIPVE